jgi:hypothetical protein
MTIDRTTLDRRAFLAAVGRAGKALAATSLLRVSPLAPSAAMLASRAHAEAGDLLVQPPEIRSRNGVLYATLTAASGTVRLGEVTLSGFLYNNAYLPPLVMLGGFQEIEFDFAADSPGRTLFHFHQQLHMDFGFMTLFDYV